MPGLLSSSGALAMYAGDRKVFPTRNGIVVELLDGSFAWYRIADGRLEVRHSDDRWWSEVPAEDILQHLVLDSPVATWLHDRMILQPAEAVRPYVHLAQR